MDDRQRRAKMLYHVALLLLFAIAIVIGFLIFER